MERTVEDLASLAATLSPKGLRDLIDSLSPGLALSLLEALPNASMKTGRPRSPLEQARELFPDFVSRDHLRHLSKVIRRAVRDVEEGKDRRIIVEMPPRSGKTLLTSMVTGGWLLSTHPSWPIALTSHDGSLATSWGREIRRWVTEGRLGSHLKIARDAGAASTWQTTEGGTVLSRSVRESLTGRGAKVMLIDDPHKDFAEAHSKKSRDNIWDWWLSVAQTRLQPPSLVIVVMTRWHEDDMVGRLLSPEYPGDPAEWEVVRIPAIAEEGDVLGRAEGEPLLSPLLPDETADQAIARWEAVKLAVGSYVWSAMYQQRPSAAEGSLFHVDDFRYWTTNPELVSDSTVLLPQDQFARGRWVDSWDCAFKGSDASDWVVGQRWFKHGPNRYLIDQKRERMTFTKTLAAMRRWAEPGLGYLGTNDHVHQRLVEDTANGPAILDTLKKELAGFKPIKARGSKESRAQAITPEIESGHVYLPHPSEFPWVPDLVSELRNFPNDAHDDQVDALTQGLAHLRDAGAGRVTIPGAQGARLDTRRSQSLLTMRRR